MKTLIAYASKSGTTEKTARLLADRLPGAALVNLNRETPNPAEYDCVVVGGSIRMGALNAGARDFLKHAKPILMKKRLAIFVCCMSEENHMQALKSSVDPEILAMAQPVASFGGELDVNSLHGFDKMIIKLVMKSKGAADPTGARLKPERIEAFAEALLKDAASA